MGVDASWLALQANKPPNLVNLNPGAIQVATLFIHDALATFANTHAKAHDGVAVNTCNPFNAADAAALCEHGHRQRLFFDW
jgi:hypothetical protein